MSIGHVRRRSQSAISARYISIGRGNGRRAPSARRITRRCARKSPRPPGQLRDPADGSQVVPTVYKREEVFHGLSASQLPDLVLHTDRAKYVSFGHADFGSNKIIEPSTGQTGHHHMVGITGLNGPGVAAVQVLPEASLLDLAPTILHYMGLPVPSYMDGRVLTEAFTDDFNAANPVRRGRGRSNRRWRRRQVSAEEEALVMEKLRDLGMWPK